MQTLKGDVNLTRHIWDGMSIVADENERGVYARYIRGGSLLAREQDGLLQYYIFNARGDVVQRTDHAGTSLKRYDYDAFGNERDPEALNSNPFCVLQVYYLIIC